MRELNEMTMFIRQHGDQNNQNDLKMEKKNTKKRNKTNGTSPANFSSQWINLKQKKKR